MKILRILIGLAFIIAGLILGILGVVRRFREGFLVGTGTVGLAVFLISVGLVVAGIFKPDELQ